MKKNYKAILIDLDGTLLGSKGRLLTWSFLFFFYLAFRKERLSLFQTFSFLKSLRRAIEKAGGGETNFDRAIAVGREYLSGTRQEVEEKMSRKMLWVFKKVRFCFYPFKNSSEVNALLNELSEYRLILATNPAWPKECVYERISWSGIDVTHFDMITTSDQMHFSKPNIEYYEELLEKLEMPAEQVLMIGDSPVKDGVCTKAGIAFFQVQERASRIEGFLELERELIHET